MNCLEFRREILVDPRRLSDEAHEHGATCATCSQFRSETLKLDERILAGFLVPVPEGLAFRVAQEAKAGGAGSRRRFMALAASLVLGVAVGTGAYVAARDDPLARAGIDFVVDSEVKTILLSKPTDATALRAVAQRLHVNIPDRIGEVRYIGICPFQGTIAHHVVIVTPSGKATLLLFPERPVEEKSHASARGLRAVVVPAGAGSMAIIAGATDINRIEQMVVHG